MNREQMAYQIYYSHLLESMTARFNGRVNKTLSFMLIVLGSTVAISHFNPVFMGLLIALISALNTVGAFGSSAELSRVQSSRYLRLYNCLHLVRSDEELMQQLMKIQEDDHIPNPTIAKLAGREAGKTFDTFKVQTTPSKMERVYSFFIG
ncbi:hypothetical protein HB991_03140 [Yersinia mollaretii]|uniref:Uncharacterized protein n=1 Tax=Yersinia mollaretii TaxID=33060 RepID=A0AA44CIT4_YERMO|nr:MULTISPECIES: hypothetical protein [Yersinia]NIL21520.1 hypothetical protein [Yersinia mollaretii]CNH99242.1 Uncharacterised protein [Yersinia intermedia]